ncbi:dethiobiotin synthase [Clostridium sp. DJ247]|uniref:dethiobiotin synthase n=1 Tax=Clostridium sp. DJ247 TaxID=2726188 RepID=UPI0016286A1F|nr:dethiobiotin synthase [Clostridium sp. DJ247]MBC2580966.1 dethiobiotin synthase [Clostridium sp. DJ247]
MSNGLFVIGTDTDVGKTFVTAGITYVLRKNNYNACSFKPVQSGGILRDEKLLPGDVEFVKNVTQINENYGVMNSYCFKAAVSPHLAAEMENISISKNKILEDYKKLKEKYDYVVVEGAGGTIVPLIRNKYYIYDLIKDLDIPVVIVAGSGIGTINHTALTVNFIKSKGIEIKGLIINGHNNSFYEDDNIEVIRNITGLEIVSVINKVNTSLNGDLILNVKNEYEKSLKIEKILDLF